MALSGGSGERVLRKVVDVNVHHCMEPGLDPMLREEASGLVNTGQKPVVWGISQTEAGLSDEQQTGLTGHHNAKKMTQCPHCDTCLYR